MALSHDSHTLSVPALLPICVSLEKTTFKQVGMAGEDVMSKEEQECVYLSTAKRSLVDT